MGTNEASDDSSSDIDELQLAGRHVVDDDKTSENITSVFSIAMVPLQLKTDDDIVIERFSKKRIYLYQRFVRESTKLYICL